MLDVSKCKEYYDSVVAYAASHENACTKEEPTHLDAEYFLTN